MMRRHEFAIERDRAEQLNIIAVNIRALTDLSLGFGKSIDPQPRRHPQRRFDRGVCPGPPGMAVYYASKSSLCTLSQGMF